MKEDLTLENIESLKSNLKKMKNILKEAFIFSNQFDAIGNLIKRGLNPRREEEKLLRGVLSSLLFQLKIINDSIPEIMKRISFSGEIVESVKPAEKVSKEGEENLISLRYRLPIEKKEGIITIKKSEKIKFLKELSLADSSVKRLKKDYKITGERVEGFKQPSSYARISNKFFSKWSNALSKRNYFKEISGELRKANLYFLSTTYISMAFFTSLLAFLFSIFLFIFLLFFNIGFEYPFITEVGESIFLRVLKTFWIIIVIPVLTFVAFVLYPTTEKRSIAAKIDQELPFVAIHMSAIAGSGIEPTKVFKIIVLSKEYPNVKKEFKKLLNEINIYGYDIVTALRNGAKVTSSDRLAELFKGLATTITSGGNLKEFLDKRSKTLIFDYRIEREKYTKTAETFMDIYISVVIAAPMILTLLLVMISLTGLSFGFSLNVLTLLMLLGLSLINIFFLIFLHMKQPKI